jgi:hypothetical protein
MSDLLARCYLANSGLAPTEGAISNWISSRLWLAGARSERGDPLLGHPPKKLA